MDTAVRPERLRAARGGVAMALAAAALAAPADANDLYVAPSFLADETLSSDANFGTSALSRSDLITEFEPSLVLRGVTRRLTVNSDLSLDAVDYRHGSEPDRILPRGGVDALVEAVDKHLYLDAAALASQSKINLLAASPEGPSTYNTFTTANYRLSPYVKGELPAGVLYVVRSDNGWVRATGTGVSPYVNSQLNRESVDVDKLPQAIGWSVHLDSAETRFVDSPAPMTRASVARLVLKVAVGPEWVLNLRGGAEQESFLRDGNGDAIYGAGFAWHPTDRSDVGASVERSFFGSRWTYGIDHHTGRLVLKLNGGRDVVTSAQAAFVAPAGSRGMADLLESMLLTSIPDPIARARAVQDTLAQSNLADAVQTAAPVYDATPMLITSHNASLAWLGRRGEAASLSLFDVRTQVPFWLLRPDVLATGGTSAYDQRGLALTLAHQLGPYTSLSASARTYRYEGLATTGSGLTKQNVGSLRLSHDLTPKTSVFGSVRLQAIESDVTPAAREKAVVVGVGHRF
jgi:uncharacterized protein (PEP-CTERM system associated)